jgi:SAM-dependent methyltransferase
MTVEEISGNPRLSAFIHPYAASQPSIVRRALTALGAIEDYAFVDLGCGKGRVTVVASEFSFRVVAGVELSPVLAEIARANAAAIRRKLPHRTKIDIFEANALTFPLPAGKLVIFLYHPFGRELVSELIGKLEDRIPFDGTHLFIVYYNPVHGDLFDASAAFSRWYAESIPYDAAEIGFGPNNTDTVVIWQGGAVVRETPHSTVNRRIVRTDPRWRADLAP